MTTRYQLRRVKQLQGNSVTAQCSANDCIILERECVKFGRNPEQVDVVLESETCNNMISRDHAEIRRQRNDDGTTAYYIVDKSLNGTYINEYRARSAILLHPGDVVSFGHINGAAILPGQHAPQPDAEFTYIFERVPRISNSQAQSNPLGSMPVTSGPARHDQQAMNSQSVIQHPQLGPSIPQPRSQAPALMQHSAFPAAYSNLAGASPLMAFQGYPYIHQMQQLFRSASGPVGGAGMHRQPSAPFLPAQAYYNPFSVPQFSGDSHHIAAAQHSAMRQASYAVPPPNVTVPQDDRLVRSLYEDSSSFRWGGSQGIPLRQRPDGVLEHGFQTSRPFLAEQHDHLQAVHHTAGAQSSLYRFSAVEEERQRELAFLHQQHLRAQAQAHTPVQVAQVDRAHLITNPVNSTPATLQSVSSDIDVVEVVGNAHVRTAKEAFVTAPELNTPLNRLTVLSHEPTRSFPVKPSVITASAAVSATSHALKMECDTTTAPSPPPEFKAAHSLTADNEDKALNNELQLLAQRCAHKTDSPDETFDLLGIKSHPNIDIPVTSTPCQSLTAPRYTSPGASRSGETSRTTVSTTSSVRPAVAHPFQSSARQRVLDSKKRKSNELARLLEDAAECSTLARPRRGHGSAGRSAEGLRRSQSSSSLSSSSSSDASDAEQRKAVSRVKVAKSSRKKRSKCERTQRGSVDIGKTKASAVSDSSSSSSEEDERDDSAQLAKGRTNDTTASLSKKGQVLGTNVKSRKRSRPSNRRRKSDAKPASTAGSPIVAKVELDAALHLEAQECAAGAECQKPMAQNLDWVECDDCSRWFHCGCVGVDVHEVEDDDIAFHCRHCDTKGEVEVGSD